MTLEFIEKMENIPAFIDSALVEKLFLLGHKNAIMAETDTSDQIRKIIEYIEKKLPSRSDIFVKALLQSDNDYLVGKLLPGITDISDVRRHFNLDNKPSAIKFEGKYQIENFLNFRVHFINYMSDMPIFIDLALAVNLLTSQHKDQICSIKNPTDQIRQMCDIVGKKLPSQSDEFIYCLIESGNDYLVNLLVTGFTTLDYSKGATTSPGVAGKSQADANNCYAMENRGRVLIIDNVHFYDEEYNREGSEKDRKDLEEFFNGLDFEVIVQQDLTAEQMETVLDEQINDDKGLTEDCFILFILSHGRVSEIIGVDMNTMHYSVIYEKFNNCDMWNEKPKLIYIQACQPILKDEDVKEEELDAQKVESSIYPGGHTYIMYATIPGDYAMRHTTMGSRLIQSLIKVYKENYLEQDVERMGVKVRQLVYRKPDSEILQIAVCHASLPKMVYLAPS